MDMYTAPTIQLNRNPDLGIILFGIKERVSVPCQCGTCEIAQLSVAMFLPRGRWPVTEEDVMGTSKKSGGQGEERKLTAFKGLEPHLLLCLSHDPIT